MRAPKTPGLYWLALDEGGAFTHDMPLLVRVTILAPYGEGRIEFLNLPGSEDQWSGYNALIDSPTSDGLAAFANGSLHRFKDREVKLHWLGTLRAPKMPKGGGHASPMPGYCPSCGQSDEKCIDTGCAGYWPSRVKK